MTRDSLEPVEVDHGDPGTGDGPDGSEAPVAVESDGSRRRPPEHGGLDRVFDVSDSGDLDRGRLRRYLRRSCDSSGSRPETGESVPVAIEDADVQRARRALRSLGERADVADRLALAATSLEISLQDVSMFVRGRPGPVPVNLDAWDCALLTFALLEAGAGDGPNEPLADNY